MAAITSEIERRESASREQRFAAQGRGFYGLAEPADPLGGGIDSKNAEVRARLREALSEMDPREFEAAHRVAARLAWLRGRRRDQVLG